MLLTLAAGLAWLLRARSAALRHRIWAVALASTLVLPLASSLLPEVSVRMPRVLLPEVSVRMPSVRMPRVLLPEVPVPGPGVNLAAGGVLAGQPAVDASAEDATSGRPATPDSGAGTVALAALAIVSMIGTVGFVVYLLVSLCRLWIQRFRSVQLSWPEIHAALRDTSPSVWGDAFRPRTQPSVTVLPYGLARSEPSTRPVPPATGQNRSTRTP